MFKAEKTAIFMNIFFPPFSMDVATVPEDFQIEVIDMQNNTYLKKVFSQQKTEMFINLMWTPRNLRL